MPLFQKLFPHRSSNFVVLALTFIAVLFAMRTDAQSSNFDNQLNTLSPVGIPPHASTSGTNEQIALATGTLNVAIPLLNLPQRGGWSLPLGYTYNSNYYSPLSDVQIGQGFSNSDGTTIHFTNRNYHERMDHPRNLLEPTVPRLQASIEYDQAVKDNGDPYGTAAYIGNFCVTNWVFTDWSGNAHAFPEARPSCSNRQNQFNIPGPSNALADSFDGSFYLIDFSNPSEVVVTAKDGTQYHFHGNWDYYSNIPSGVAGSGSGNLENEYDNRDMTMVDPNGNTIKVVRRSDQTQYPTSAWTITDTIGRTISMGQDGIDYLDDNSVAQRIILSAPTAGTPLAQDLSYARLDCYYLGPTSPGATVTVDSAPAKSSSATSLVTISMPKSDISGTARAYKLLFDPAGHLIRIDYPSGGYTRYDFKDYFNSIYNAGVACATNMFQVSRKYSCSNSSGSCGSEDTTVYTSLGIRSADSAGNSPFNTSVTETDPVGRTTTHTFNIVSPRYTSPFETDVVMADSSGKTKRTVHTDYAVNTQFSQLSYPKQVKTTLNDSPNGSFFLTNYEYGESFLLHGHDIPVTLDNPTKITFYDFAGHLLQTTANLWKPASAFAVPHMLDRIDTQTVTDGVDNTAQQIVWSYDAQGNVHSRTRSASGVLTQTTTYGVYTGGNPASVMDSLNNTTTFGYADSFIAGPCTPTPNSGAYRTSVTLPNGAKTAFTYNACTGSVASMTDANNNTTTYTYDALGRQRSAKEPGAFSTTTDYSDSFPNSATLTTMANPDPSIVHVTTLDGLGRVTSSVTGGNEVFSTYDGVGRVHSISNPKPTGTSGSGDTTYAYDALDHVISMGRQDGNAVLTPYVGEYSVLHDEAGNARVNTFDARGLLVSVCEVAGASSAGESPGSCPTVPGQGTLSGYITNYTYNGKGLLTKVAARNQTRSFNYDAVGQLITAQNPETGTICYGTGSSCASGYDANGNLKAITDPRGEGSLLTYDSLNRIKTRAYFAPSYTDPPVKQFFYDGAAPSGSLAIPAGSNQIGRLTMARSWAPFGNGFHDEYQTYDAAGRVTKRTEVSQSESGTSGHSLSIGYDLAGNPTSLVYPDGRTLSQAYDSAGRLLSVSPATGSPYVSGLTYFPNGSPNTVNYGNGMVEAFALNSRLQPCADVVTAKPGNIMVRNYFYGMDTTPGNNCNPTTGNNGNILHVMDGISGGLNSQHYLYDPLNRIRAWNGSNSDGTPRKQTFDYDSFGNLNQTDGSTPATPTLTSPAPYNAQAWPYDSNNHLQASYFHCAPYGLSTSAGAASLYDGGGNVLCSGTQNIDAQAYGYNEENQLVLMYGYQNNNTYVTAGQYSFDSSGQRVRADRYPQSATQHTWGEYTYLNGQMLAEKDQTGAWTDYIYASGKRVAKISGDAPAQPAGSTKVAVTFTNDSCTGCSNTAPNQDRNLFITGITVGGVAADLTKLSYSGCTNIPGASYNSNDGLYCSGTATVAVPATGPVVVSAYGTPDVGAYPHMLVSVNGDLAGEWDLTQSTAGYTATPGSTNPALATRYYVADQVGTAQFEVSASGWPLWHGEFAPFGQELELQATSDRFKFTGKERDSESGLDYFGARYYSSNMGRFMSPDPGGLLFQKPQDPQSWNLYAYARNNPLSNVDPTGLDCVYANDAGNGVESIDHSSNSGECGQNGGSWAPGYVNENWAHFNTNTNMFQVGSINGTGSSATVDYTMFGAGATTQFNGDETACTSGCSGFSLANADWLSGQLVGNSMSGGLGGYIQFLAGRELQLSTFSQIAYGPLDYSQNNWAGPGGFGPPSGGGDWRASVHDYNFNTNGITIGSYFNPSLSPATSRALIQSNSYLMQTGGYQGAKEKIFFGAVNAFQWASHLF